jgi:hypothetical protein
MDADDAAVRSAAEAAASGDSTGEQYNAAAEAAAFLAAAQRKVLFLVTPKLAAYARQYYGCDSLPGAPADALSEGSHWRQANINVSGLPCSELCVLLYSTVSQQMDTACSYKTSAGQGCACMRKHISSCQNELASIHYGSSNSSRCRQHCHAMSS